jgi:formamidopyrimidine-DNA glycosylase
MPELPDVEVFKRYLSAHALHRQIARVKASSPGQLAGTSARSLSRALVRKRFESTYRHGKHLFVRIGGGRWLMLHFGRGATAALGQAVSAHQGQGLATGTACAG